MARRPSDILRPGAKVTGRKLLEAINAAAVVPFGSRKMLVSSSGPQATVRDAGHQIIPKLAPFPVILGAATSIGTNRWEYAWVQARMNTTTGLYEPETVSPITNLSSGERKALNIAEQKNTASIVRNGEPVTIGSSTITIGPVGTAPGAVLLSVPVFLWIAGTLTNSLRQRVFSEANPVHNVVCA